MTHPRVLLVDDHPAILQRAALLLADEFEIVGAVSDGQTALDAVDALNPDVVVLDISMPGLTGLEVAARLLKMSAPPRVVFLTVQEDQDLMDAARKAGAVAYVVKRHMYSDLLPAVRGAFAAVSDWRAAGQLLIPSKTNP